MQPFMDPRIQLLQPASQEMVAPTKGDPNAVS